MERGLYPAKSMHQDYLEMVAGAVGAGAAALTAEPTTGTTLLAVRDNFFSSCTQTSTGLFVVTFKEMPPTVLNVRAYLINASGTHLRVAVRSWSITAKTVTIEVRDLSAADAVADPTTSDHIRVVVVGRESTV